MVHDGDVGGDRYAAFISYARAADGQFAEALHSGVENFATRSRRGRAVRVFRDDATMSANADLTGAIQAALATAEWFVLVASPESAASHWVQQELHWWLTHRSADRLVVVLTAGELVWSGSAGFGAHGTTAWPDPPRFPLAREPRWIDARWSRGEERISRRDPRLVANVADVAAQVRGVPKDSLIGEHVRLRRRARRGVQAAVAVLVVLLFASATATWVAVDRTAEARRQLAVAQARQLASRAEALAPTDLQSALLLAERAYALDPDGETRRALFAVLTGQPALVGFFEAGAQVTTVAGTADGVVVAGTEAGTVQVWRAGATSPHTAWTAGGPVTDVAVSADGTVVAAVSGVDVGYERSGTWTAWPDPAVEASVVAVSDDGSTIAVAGLDPGTGEAVLQLLRPGTGELSRGVLPGLSTPARLALDEAAGEVVVSDEMIGRWDRVGVEDTGLHATGVLGLGAHGITTALAPDGSGITMTSGAGAVPVVSTRVSDDYPTPDLFGDNLGVDPTALALGPGMRTLAVADSGRIHVSEVGGADDLGSSTTTLAGISDVPAGGLVLTSARTLLAAGGSTVSQWDLDRAGPLAQRRTAELPIACEACPGPLPILSPDGRWAVVWSPEISDGLVVDLAGDAEMPLPVEPAETGFAPVFVDDTTVVLSGPSEGSIEFRSVIDPSVPQRVARIPGAGPVLAAATDGTGAAVTVLDAGGVAYVVDVATGQVSGTGAALLGAPQEWTAMAVSADGGWVAGWYLDGTGSTIVVASTEGGEPLHLPGHGLRFAGDTLLMFQDLDSTLAWPLGGGADDVAVVPGPDAAVDLMGGGDLMVAPMSSGDVALWDTGGVSLGSLPGLPPTARARGVWSSPDGAVVAVATPDDTFEGGGWVDVWETSTVAWVRTACKLAGRELTREEMDTALGNSSDQDLRCGR
ncbi:toll/interleukin-1 receptor domain-containing protein [Klenkia sp. PcliD-1-E]|uniref:TIR domain-containing protein n=1 Tax=Klenkia sp. PcliD-1-E TaxID=2954492 RepID=UPI0020969119|nr:toll/interleukin-1 receptor domain-containing protein [Klenkia sp. PcliD-1-E]MCO7219366.1 toll/interleukin-1 receptor domain-containing protein [Klenkia sp. PcliD-1-E]